jgi:nucleotide-binding universal stress UspA family protein
VIGTVLYAVDGSDLALAAMPGLLGAVDLEQTEIVVLQVVDSVQMVLAREVPPPREAEKEAELAVAGARAAAEAHLEDVAARLRAAGARRVETVVREGRAGREIVDCASERGAGLVVMGTHGRSGLRRVVMGSVAHYVLGQLEVPLMLVRPSEE